MADAFRLPVLDSTARDYESIRDLQFRLIDFFAPEWTDRRPSNKGIVLLQLYAGVADMLNFQVDFKGRDRVLRTLLSRRAAIDTTELIDFIPPSASPASADVFFTLGAPLGGDLLIPKGVKVRSTGSDAVTYETAADLTIPAGNTGDEVDGEGAPLFAVSVVEGETTSEDLDDATGVSFQEFAVVGTPIVDGSFKLFIDEGGGEIEWTFVDSFADSGPSDTHYTISKDEQEVLTIRLGDNGNGRIPAPGSTVRGEYRLLTAARGGLKVFGNVGAGVISVVATPVLFLGTPISLEVENPESATGGGPPMPIDEIKELAPRSLRAQNRVVVNEDYTTESLKFPGVARASVSRGLLPNEVVVSVIPDGGGVPSQALLDGLLAEIVSKGVFGLEFRVEAGETATVEIEGVVSILSNFDLDLVKAEVLAAIESFFSLASPDVDFGRGARLSDVLALIDNIEGVDTFEPSRLTHTPIIEQVVKSGDQSVSTVTLSLTTRRETWTITFLTSTTFQAVGSVSGLQTGTGTVGVPYSTDEDEILFTVIAGALPAASGDRFTIKTSPLIGSVILADTEFPVLGALDGLLFEVAD